MEAAVICRKIGKFALKLSEVLCYLLWRTSFTGLVDCNIPSVSIRRKLSHINVAILSCDIPIILHICVPHRPIRNLHVTAGSMAWVTSIDGSDVTSQGSDQTALMCSLIWAFACHQCHAWCGSNTVLCRGTLQHVQTGITVQSVCHLPITDLIGCRSCRAIYLGNNWQLTGINIYQLEMFFREKLMSPPPPPTSPFPFPSNE